ncbi:MAG: YkgJ family cysteine cluster protein [Weeksellaceae bacterium]
MSVEEKVKWVEKLFYQLEQEGVQFAKSSGISCVAGCGMCCTHPEIEASPLEFLPWAFHLFLEGKAEQNLHLLNQSKTLTCFFFKSLSIQGHGRCTDYKFRGLICRLFGYAANADKYGSLRMATCKIIKEGQNDKYNSTEEAISKGLYVPVFTHYYMQLNQIDFQLGNKTLPINKALKQTLEEVLHYYAYRPLADSDKQYG